MLKPVKAVRLAAVYPVLVVRLMFLPSAAVRVTLPVVPSADAVTPEAPLTALIAAATFAPWPAAFTPPATAPTLTPLIWNEFAATEVNDVAAAPVSVVALAVADTPLLEAMELIALEMEEALAAFCPGAKLPDEGPT